MLRAATANFLVLSHDMPPRKTDRRTTIRRLEYITIECVTPELDAGRHPVKRVVGDEVWVGADVCKEGHDQLAAQVVYMGPGDGKWSVARMLFDYDSDRWYGLFRVDRIGRWTFSIEGWTDVFGTWRSDLRKKVDAGQTVDLELLEGAQLLRAASRGAKLSAARAALLNTAKALENRESLDAERRVKRALDTEVLALMATHARRRDLTRYARELQIVVDVQRARFAAWYEMFPRSQGHPERFSHRPERGERVTAVAGAAPQDDREPSLRPQDDLGAHPKPAHGTFADAERQLPRLADLGFDVVYLPPIHPIGFTFRKGKNNTLDPRPEDVGSPWAIGNNAGGHTAIEPQLGTIDDFDRFVRRANDLGLDVALDYALQCSPDHPWVKEHPDWFHIRPDGSIKYAENPPKKYQDIYPLNFWCADRQGLWNACRDVVRFWIEHGVTTFRVDNPHTKPFAFWEWMIADIKRRHPETIFFSEAFTRPNKMKYLAKLGFTMSYTYFTWKNDWWDLRQYFEELTDAPIVEYFRGNLFTNTPDILTEYLVDGGRPAFRIRLLLATTLLPLYGIYSGFELIENVPVRPGSEEYLDSEKYQIKPRDWNAPGNLNDEIALLNRIRRENVALQRYANLTFHTSDNPTILFYRKAPSEPRVQWTNVRGHPVPATMQARLAPATPETVGDNFLIAVNTDPHHAHETMVHVPIHDMGIDLDEPYLVHDLLTGNRYQWRGERNYVRLDPSDAVGHLFRVERPDEAMG
jgi:starch synthase (maltosyl-transferring)